MPHMGFGTVEFDVISVMLHAFEHAVFIGVPSAGDPRKLQTFFDARPHTAQPVHVAGERPVQICVNDLPHLPVGRREAGALHAIGQHLPEMHRARIVHRVAERGSAERPGQRREQMRSGTFVIPHVRAVAEAAAAIIVHAFESVELAVGSAEAGGARERGKISAGRILHDRRKSAFAKSLGEQPGLPFEPLKIRSRIFSGGQRGRKSHAVVVADDRFPSPFGRAPAAPVRRAIRKSPREQERELGGTARRDRPLKRETPTALCGSGAAERRPSSEKSSQNNIGEFHHRPCGQPRQISV